MKANNHNTKLTWRTEAQARSARLGLGLFIGTTLGLIVMSLLVRFAGLSLALAQVVCGIGFVYGFYCWIWSGVEMMAIMSVKLGASYGRDTKTYPKSRVYARAESLIARPRFIALRNKATLCPL